MNRIIIENYKTAELDGKVRFIEFDCPKCNQGVSIHTNHSVEEKGIVNPSMVCPHKDCGFHEWIELKNWNKGNFRIN